jgi:hypothetical protein
MDTDRFLNFSIKARNFKCFGEEPVGFNAIKPINLVIGRNNSGKSALLDIIEYAAAKTIDVPESQWHANQRPEFHGTLSLPDNVIARVFPHTTSGGGIPGRHSDFGARLVGSALTWRLNAARGERFVSIGTNPNGEAPFDEVKSETKTSFQKKLADAVENPLEGKAFQRIFAERNIVPEPDQQNDLSVLGDGRGATNLIQNFINKASLPHELIEDVLLGALNEVFAVDGHFTDIVCQQYPNGAWEIFLEERSKGRIALSQSGSGLKTIILVLAFIHLLPHVSKRSLTDFLFGFEELENNLHPSLLRRLLSYLRDTSVTQGCTCFLTTHSNVVIDLFSRDDSAQIIHVTHDGGNSKARRVSTYVDNCGVLDDLDVRASDLLQANGIIWVEGPSDRIYINRWIQLFSGSELIEGDHYQCVFYGGRLLSHLSSEDPDAVDDGVAILRVNRNAILVMDSDLKAQGDKINSTKDRICTEVSAIGGLPWVTEGREIENYIPSEALAACLELSPGGPPQVGLLEDFFEYLDGLKPGLGTRYSRKKPLLAEMIAPYLTRESLAKVAGLSEALQQMCSRIRSWNGMKNL